MLLNINVVLVVYCYKIFEVNLLQRIYYNLSIK